MEFDPALCYGFCDSVPAKRIRTPSPPRRFQLPKPEVPRLSITGELDAAPGCARAYDDLPIFDLPPLQAYACAFSASENVTASAVDDLPLFQIPASLTPGCSLVCEYASPHPVSVSGPPLTTRDSTATLEGSDLNLPSDTGLFSSCRSKAGLLREELAAMGGWHEYLRFLRKKSRLPRSTDAPLPASPPPLALHEIA